MIWLIFLIVATLPTYLLRFKIGQLPTTALEVLILITATIWLWNKLRKKQLLFFLKNFPRIWLILSLLWLFAATLAIFVSPNSREALGIWKAYFLEPLILFFIAVDTIKTRDDLHIIFTGLGISAIFISIIALGQKFFGLTIPTPWQEELRVTSFFEYPNAVGLFLGPLVPIFIGELGIMGDESWWRKIFFGMAAILGIFAIVLAKSEGAILGIAAALFIMGLLWNKKTRLVTIITAALIAIVLLGVPTTRSYIIEKATLRDWSGVVRRITWGETMEMLKDRPIFGAGLAGYQTAFAPYHKTAAIEIFLYPHNIFLNFWSELGIFGLSIFALIIILFFKDSLTIIPKLEIRNLKFKITLATSMATLVTHGLVDVPYFKNDLSALFWLIIGIAVALKRAEK